MDQPLKQALGRMLITMYIITYEHSSDTSSKFVIDLGLIHRYCQEKQRAFTACSYVDQSSKHVLARMLKAVLHVNIHWILVVNMS